MPKEVVKKYEAKLHRVHPATDIIECEHGYHVIMDIPGVRKEDVKIDLNHGELTVSGSTANMGTEENYIEVQFGPVEFCRTLTVADVIDQDKIKAKVENGVLELTLPKAGKMLPKRIEIQSG